MTDRCRVHCVRAINCHQSRTVAIASCSSAATRHQRTLASMYQTYIARLFTSCFTDSYTRAFCMGFDVLHEAYRLSPMNSGLLVSCSVILLHFMRNSEWMNELTAKQCINCQGDLGLNLHEPLSLHNRGLSGQVKQELRGRRRREVGKSAHFEHKITLFNMDNTTFSFSLTPGGSCYSGGSKWSPSRPVSTTRVDGPS